MIETKLQIEPTIFLELTPGEAGALDAICGYGPDVFIEWFHRTHGKYYLEPYQSHLKSLFTKAKKLNKEVKSWEEFKTKAGILANSYNFKINPISK